MARKLEEHPLGVLPQAMLLTKWPQPTTVWWGLSPLPKEALLQDLSWLIQGVPPYWEFFFFFFCFCFWFLRPHLQYMEVPRLGVKSELQLLAYTRATATRDLSWICDLHHSQILNPLREARDWTCILMGTSQIHFHWAMMGTPETFLKITFLKNKCLWIGPIQKKNGCKE